MTYYSSYTENEVYYYHSGHLGGASWITDGDGVPVQHLQYLPFGEPFVDQHPAGYQERYTFTGKERDEETGYGYFGARYMDHELMTMWLSVDPMADKYPSVSPYNYCMWNPVKLVDPDGQDVWSVSEDGHINKIGNDGGAKKQTIKYANGETAIFNGSFYQSILNDLSLCDNRISYSKGAYAQKAAMGELFLSLAKNTNVEWDIQKYKGGKYIISTLHQSSLSASPSDVGMKMSDIITTIHSHPSALANLKDEIGSMGIATRDGTRGTYRGIYSVSDYKTREIYPNNTGYFIYMRNSHNIYQLKTKDGVVCWPIKKGKITKASQLPW
jgi:RHS repeat-associated protein